MRDLALLEAKCGRGCRRCWEGPLAASSLGLKSRGRHNIGAVLIRAGVVVNARDDGTAALIRQWGCGWGRNVSRWVKERRQNEGPLIEW